MTEIPHSIVPPQWRDPKVVAIGARRYRLEQALKVKRLDARVRDYLMASLNEVTGLEALLADQITSTDYLERTWEPTR